MFQLCLNCHEKKQQQINETNKTHMNTMTFHWLKKQQQQTNKPKTKILGIQVFKILHTHKTSDWLYKAKISGKILICNASWTHHSTSPIPIPQLHKVSSLWHVSCALHCLYHFVHFVNGTSHCITTVFIVVYSLSILKTLTLNEEPNSPSDSASHSHFQPR